MKQFILAVAWGLAAQGAPSRADPVPIASRPNILWIVIDDMSANLSCYGETAIRTPHADRLAREGLMFTRAFATAPVCSPFRSAMITGMYQTTIGAHHHRSGRGNHRVRLPDGVRPVPELFRAAGYYTCIGSGLPGVDHRGLPSKSDRKGKTDYNFDWDEAMYDGHDWAGRRDGQPFFMQVQLHGGKLRGDRMETARALLDRARNELGDALDPERVVLPPHYPRDPVLLTDWAAYLESVRLTDRHTGLVIERLKKEDLLDTTLVVFFTDHGISHARGKQFLYDEGAHIPLILHGPGIAGGAVRDDLVEHIDVAALSLATAGIPVPAGMQGRDILAPAYRPRDAVFAARDRCGETTDRIRSVRTDRWLYIRNYHPLRPHLQPSQYKDSKGILIRLRELHADGRLDDLQERLLFAPERSADELYDWTRDPWQTVNLAADPAHAATLRDLSARLDAWIRDSRDPGPESPEVYAMEIEDELANARPGTARHDDFKANAEQMKRWAAEGR